ncbi:hypothetical protein CYMTET_27808 [Cymbomonas tetramitiformis]|uniref:Uncharacterized protein n=1 Tax=Cymbomonas tetramitiformis TaxID=36881 RepID=A0AAE0FPG6_9CHLO|nr:hypothetical protein CYMTET_27808 [Cymbomonas tetramitiformis]
MAFIESAIKGARGLPAYMEKLTNSIRLVAVTEEAANNIESKALAFPDLPDLVSAIREIFTQAGLGEAVEHLKQLPATTTEAIIQALKNKLTSQWANVVKGGAAGDEEILKLRNAVEKLEDTCKNGFTESVQATNQDKPDERKKLEEPRSSRSQRTRT